MIRAATAEDDGFILGFVERFTDFELPQGRPRHVVTEGIRRDILDHLNRQPGNSFWFILEDDEGACCGFTHLQLVDDFFSERRNCHIADLGVHPMHEGKGHAKTLLAHAAEFAREHRCERLTLNVFPGNERARDLYEAEGWDYDLLRMCKPL